jgi:hypothetical protein
VFVVSRKPFIFMSDKVVGVEVGRRMEFEAILSVILPYSGEF